MAEGHEPHLGLRPVQQRCAIEYEPGKQLIIAYPANGFFEGSSSLSMYRFVPLNIASMIASL